MYDPVLITFALTIGKIVSRYVIGISRTTTFLLGSSTDIVCNKLDYGRCGVICLLYWRD